CCYCHCSICRKLTGSGSGAYGSVSRSEFEWLSNESLSRFSPMKSTTRYFCSSCGSFLLTEHSAEPENVFVSLGTLDSPIESKPKYRQFVGNAPAWSSIEDDLPLHDGWPH
ncbi:MAG: GFA family protein, partial [Pseudomonadales bacterium]